MPVREIQQLAALTYVRYVSCGTNYAASAAQFAYVF